MKQRKSASRGSRTKSKDVPKSVDDYLAALPQPARARLTDDAGQRERLTAMTEAQTDTGGTLPVQYEPETL